MVRKRNANVEVIRRSLNRLRSIGRSYKYGGGLIWLQVAEDGLEALERVEDAMDRMIPVRQDELI